MSAMPVDNSEEIAQWNGPMGQRWVEMQRHTDRIVAPFGDAALKAAAPQPGERVVDIGCGCGGTSIDLARSVGSAGAVLGVDVSRPMLDAARAERAAQRLPNLEFREADASEALLPTDNDLLFSRFGVMFFSAPTRAFAQMRKSLRPGGRCAFVCWRVPRDNPWAMVPLTAARAAMGITPPPADPNAPGPFAFADEARLQGILAGAGFVAIDMQRFDTALTIGATPRAAAEGCVQIGPVSRLLREVGAEHATTILDAVERAVAPLAEPDGRVRLSGSTWIVSATNR